MAVLWLSLGMLLTALYLLGSSRGSVMPGHLSLIAITLVAALHQGVCLWIMRRGLDGIHVSWTVYNYVNSFIEVSCVSVAMLILVGSIEPALAMLGVPLLGYFLMLITSSLKLDSALCVFVGVVAAAQYGLVAWCIGMRSSVTTARAVQFRRLAIQCASACCWCRELRRAWWLGCCGEP
jgi:uncharacterized membrane protein YvlD (DUF360 family)